VGRRGSGATAAVDRTTGSAAVDVRPADVPGSDRRSTPLVEVPT
jgi:hypothetical protein